MGEQKAKQAPPQRQEQLERWPIGRFIPAEDNPRKHSTEAVEQFAKAIQRFGFRVPILARSTGDIVDGHLRLKAALHLGLDSLPVVIADDMSEDDIKAFRISVNRMSELAEWDQDKLFRDMEHLETVGELLSELGPIGFELENFDAPAPVEAWDFSQTHDIFVVTIQGSLPLEAEVRRRLVGLEGVKVEVSSIEKSSP